MYRSLWLGGVALLGVSCLLQPHLVAIDPEHGYVDGCTDVMMQGSKLGTEATVTIGGQALLELAPAAEDPALPAHAQDVGFKYLGRTPPSVDGQKGYTDVVMTVDGEKLVLPKGFYYMDCPDTFAIDETTIGAEMRVGDAFEVVGCGLSAEDLVGRLLTYDGTSVAATFELSLTCSTARATADIPDVAAGQYWLEIEHTDGTLFGGACLTGADTGSDNPDTADDTDEDTDVDTDEDTDVDTDEDTDADAETGDSAGDSAWDTADPCASTVLVTIVEGGA